MRRARPTQIWIDEQALAEAGHTIDEVADALAAATRRSSRVAPSSQATPMRLAFSAAFPTSDLDGLACLPPSARD